MGGAVQRNVSVGVGEGTHQEAFRENVVCVENAEGAWTIEVAQGVLEGLAVGTADEDD